MNQQIANTNQQITKIDIAKVFINIMSSQAAEKPIRPKARPSSEADTPTTHERGLSLGKNGFDFVIATDKNERKAEGANLSRFEASGGTMFAGIQAYAAPQFRYVFRLMIGENIDCC